MVNNALAYARSRPLHVATLVGLSALLCGQSAPPGCNPASQATINAVAQSSCAVINAVAASSVQMNSKTQAAVNSGVAACLATNNGANVTIASQTVAILAAVTVLQQSGIAPKALAPDLRPKWERISQELANHDAELKSFARD